MLMCCSRVETFAAVGKLLRHRLSVDVAIFGTVSGGCWVPRLKGASVELLVHCWHGIGSS